MSHTVPLTKLIYEPARFKTPNIKQEVPSPEQTKDVMSNTPILMDEYGQTPDHYYLARKPPPSFFQVKRKLNLQTIEAHCGSETKLIKRRRKLDTIPSKPRAKKVVAEKRCDTSLGQLTKNFLKLLSDAVDGVINLNTACHLLCVPKRRLYDITNVLEGAGLVQKTSRNNIQWMGRVASSPANDGKYEMEKEIDILEAKENNLDELIYHMKSEINMLKETEGKYHYITSNDLKEIEEFSRRMILGVKIAPTGQLIETFEKKMVLSSKSSEMEAVLITEDVCFMNILHPRAEFKENSYNIKISNNRLKGFDDELTVTEDGSFQRMIDPYKSVSSLYNRACAAATWNEGDTVFKNAFITEEDDIAPMGKNFLLQTEDQDLDSFPFVDFESEVDSYSFCLDDGEGLTDLFDCKFV